MKKLLLSVAFLSATFIGANAQTVLSQTSGEVPFESTIACAVSGGAGQPAIGISESSYYRVYTMTSDFVIGAVRIGVGSATGDFPATIKLHSSAGAFPASYPAGLTELASVDVTITEANELTLVDYVLDSVVSVSSGDVIVVEVFNVNTSVAEGGNGSVHYMGIANNETAPAYLLAGGCGLTTPSTFASLGFPEGKLILDLVEGTASTEDFASNFSVYPNPATNVINVANSADVINNVTITDLNGRTVKQVTVGVNDAQINISDLAQGVYILNATSNGKSFTQKIVKQ